jgi:deoxyribodipyrimidine photo-lyase
MTQAPTLLWFRRDLRLADHAALAAALQSGAPIIPVFILDETTPGKWAPGGASRWWLHGSLASLDADLRQRGSALVLRRGAYATEIPRLMAETGAVGIHTGEAIEPWARRAIGALSTQFTIRQHRTALMFHPDDIRTGGGTPYGVFTPFSKACIRFRSPVERIHAPIKFVPAVLPPSDNLDDWKLRPTAPDWARGWERINTPGEAGAHAALAGFVPSVSGYDEQRNIPGMRGTSRLSPHLAWGEIAPDTVWDIAGERATGKGLETFRNELLWREFSAHLLYNAPALPEAPLKPAYANFPWRTDSKGLRAWTHGLTGIPIVDAGMRQLWTTGWMHNRVRMIVASFLIKHLLIDWREGEAWFWDTLIDAELAANAASWQWVAGSGADASPFFRIFNPVLQGEKFDPTGAYVRRYVPEVSNMIDKYVHQPWTAPSPPRNYPSPVVDLAFGRARALDALKIITK